MFDTLPKIVAQDYLYCERTYFGEGHTHISTSALATKSTIVFLDIQG